VKLLRLMMRVARSPVRALDFPARTLHLKCTIQMLTNTGAIASVCVRWGVGQKMDMPPSLPPLFLLCFCLLRREGRGHRKRRASPQLLYQNESEGQRIPMSLPRRAGFGTRHGNGGGGDLGRTYNS